ncbi:alpha,alpha-trehalose-phosphate synthase (UDP-forming) [Edaphobacter modestus]|uniref:alpha,alpha-trehalose-phosphate synthase (UDP-forming) n=1 Tax=Edaphobacter modestus TaxID=388466 RepID=UPI001F5EE467|nr:trehalose-6-phosphate synthase [Edaphobacter modestus]
MRLIIALILGVTLVSLASSWSDVQDDKEALRRDLQYKAETFGESLASNAELYLASGDTGKLEQLVRRFSNRDHLLGIGIYDHDGSTLVMTRELGSLLSGAPEALSSALSHDRPETRFTRLRFRRVYLLAAPLHAPDKSIIGGIVIVYETGYIRTEIFRVWGRVFIRIAGQVLVIVAITLLIVRWSVAGPIARAAQWMKTLRTGRQVVQPPSKDLDFLLPLAREMAPLAESMQRARAAAEIEARLRNTNESLWTAQRLAEHVRSKLDGSSLFVVSNREPYVHNWQGNTITVTVPASGLVTAIEPILCACNGTWVAQGSGSADAETVDNHDRLQVPPDDPKYTLRRVWLSAAEEEGYYYGFANEGLWPLCHMAHTRPTFRASDWEFYNAVNERFADALVEEMAGERDPVVLIQDYHFALLPRMIKDRIPHARVAIFWHIPWPNPESFSICPWQRELLDGLLGADLIGFHVQAHCNNFLSTVDRVLEARVDWEHFSVKRNDHWSSVLPFPISVELTEDSSGLPLDHSFEEERSAIIGELGIDATFLGVGVDRVDYTKGIIERFQAVESFLERHPRYQGKFTFIQIGAPTRSNIPRYAEFQREVESEATRINDRFKRGKWRPIVFLNRQHSHKEVRRYYRAAHVCMVTSLHDGMNLVAKEYVAARSDDRGVLILSRFTGAARELRDALIVNPYDIQGTGQAIARALEMDVTEIVDRMRRMRKMVKEHNIYWWAASLIGELCELRLKR